MSDPVPPSSITPRQRRGGLVVAGVLGLVLTAVSYPVLPFALCVPGRYVPTGRAAETVVEIVVVATDPPRDLQGVVYSAGGGAGGRVLATLPLMVATQEPRPDGSTRTYRYRVSMRRELRVFQSRYQAAPLARYSATGAAPVWFTVQGPDVSSVSPSAVWLPPPSRETSAAAVESVAVRCGGEPSR
jgi:hypothetical protein